MKYLLILLLTAAMTISCSRDEEKATIPSPVRPKAKATVIVYMAAENNLSDIALANISDMAKGSASVADSNYIVAFVDRATPQELPYIIQIDKGTVTKDSQYSIQKDFLSSDPQRFYETIKWIEDRYPADSYALVLWGHASGWMFNNDSISTTSSKAGQMAFGIDTGNNTASTTGTWLNIPSLAQALGRLPKMKYIFADCCNFQCIEVAYELRNVCDYIIGSPAEIPAQGAPYRELVPLLVSESEDFYSPIADIYNNQIYDEEYQTPISVIKTAELPQLAYETKKIMAELKENRPWTTDNLIYYYGYTSALFDTRVMYDINDFMLNNISTDSYLAWKEQLKKVVVYSKSSSRWCSDNHVNFKDFNVTGQKYSGVSMFFPMDKYTRFGLTYNEDIKKLQWYYAAGFEE